MYDKDIEKAIHNYGIDKIRYYLKNKLRLKSQDFEIFPISIKTFKDTITNNVIEKKANFKVHLYNDIESDLQKITTEYYSISILGLKFNSKGLCD